MKRFNEFINENKEDENTFEKFIKDVKTAFTKDFKRDSSKEADVFVNQYYDMLEDSWKNGFTVREAIAATKIPGFIVSNGRVDESYVLDIDDDFEKSYEIIEGIDGINRLEEGKMIINNFYDKYNRKSFSDKRIFERLKNNYHSLINKYEEKRTELSQN